ncbi:MAG: 6-phosphogluconolactonase [Pseudomonadota bacterium]|uniref:6-phosphogluconolactonase n=1 Tax=Phenylobacterium sp. TaxID=1871053 RepID=UPI0025E07F86|nr:6-phosphogluconolactonase [Phenylobacterium sp.]MBT9472501.1 6-phosphogluconolactonase [Phenylobacterium sp.]
MLEAFENPAALAEAAAAAVLEALAAAIAERGSAVLVATGGRSPAPIYDLLAQAPLDWDKVAVTLSDDRFVAPTSPDSNERLVRERLLVGPAASAHFTPLSFDVANVREAALRAEPEVKALAPYDVMLLGMGEDGHVASLIPGSPVMDEAMNLAGDRFCLGVPAGVGSPPLARVTMTMPALLQARLTLILISGQTKREIIENGGGLPVHLLLEQAKAPVRVLWTS